jgi:hypothetical protein
MFGILGLGFLLGMRHVLDRSCRRTIGIGAMTIYTQVLA